MRPIQPRSLISAELQGSNGCSERVVSRKHLPLHATPSVQGQISQGSSPVWEKNPQCLIFAFNVLEMCKINCAFKIPLNNILHCNQQPLQKNTRCFYCLPRQKIIFKRNIYPAAIYLYKLKDRHQQTSWLPVVFCFAFYFCWGVLPLSIFNIPAGKNCF